MNIDQENYSLPWTVFGRRVRPVPLSFMIIGFAVAATAFIFRGHPVFAHDDPSWYMLGGISLVSAILLFLGWLTEKDGFLQSGVLLIGSVFASSTIGHFFLIGPRHLESWVSLALLVLAVGTYTIEMVDSIHKKRKQNSLALLERLEVE